MSFEEDICTILGLSPDSVRRLELVIETGKPPVLIVQHVTITPDETNVWTQKYRVVPEEV